MERRVIPVFSITLLLCSCSGEDNKPPGPPASSPLAQSSDARQSVKERSSDVDGVESALGDYVSFRACGIKIRQPEGFEEADSFDGFGQAETQSSVMAVSIPGPYSQVIGGFTQEQMKARGWTLRSKQDVKVDGLSGILIHFEQPARGQWFLKWCLAFGDDRKTSMVTAAYPKEHERELSARLKSAVLSTRPDRAAAPPSGADLPFTLVASQKLKLAPSINRTVLYTKDGLIPAKSPEDPLFVAAPSLGDVVVGDRQQFCERELRRTAHTKQVSVKSIGTIAVDGLDGYECLAEAKDSESEAPLVVYQAILFDGASYIHMKGLVGTRLRDEFLPEFKAMARSLRRK